MRIYHSSNSLMVQETCYPKGGFGRHTSRWQLLVHHERHTIFNARPGETKSKSCFCPTIESGHLLGVVYRDMFMERERDQPYLSQKLQPITVSPWMGLIGTIVTVPTIWQVFGWTPTTCGFFAGVWTGLSMRHMLLSVSWQRVVLTKGNGEDTTTKQWMAQLPDWSRNCAHELWDQHWMEGHHSGEAKFH